MNTLNGTCISVQLSDPGIFLFFGKVVFIRYIRYIAVQAHFMGRFSFIKFMSAVPAVLVLVDNGDEF